MAHVQRFDHIGITVADLDSVTAFFVGLGLEVEGTGSVEGEFVETVCGIPGAHCEIAMLRPPDGGSRLELACFVRPDHVPGSPTAMANELGLRNVSFEVGDLKAAVDAVGRVRTRWRHRRVREQCADGLRAWARRDHRVPVRANRLTRVRVDHVCQSGKCLVAASAPASLAVAVELRRAMGS
ncbi:VOC family protein [Nocardioides sp. InS609-2]|uniref:VOC family protein n=1 Tax=Nocardioides sp. InS609-2 TaxID=2760705 RepID=UPI0020C0D432|nr:VOC family protein [Nocardioides sp. InS609-2]